MKKQKIILKDKQHYIDNATTTFNGWIYKDYDAFKSGEGVCYICESDLIDLKEGYATLEEVVETRQSIIEKCKEFEHPGMDLEDFAYEIFDWSDWTHIYTTLGQSTEWDWEG